MWLTAENQEKPFIFAPPHPDGKRNGERIVATFHTHPNTGKSYDPEPDDDDREIVDKDGDLKTVYYVGEFVISKPAVYFVHPSGEFVLLGDSTQLLALGEDK